LLLIYKIDFFPPYFRKSIKASDSSVAMETSTDVDSLQKSREILHFNKTEEEFKAMMTGIPEGMLKVTVK
jgi:hypothetical protein